MEDYIARANVDHYLDLLYNHEVPAQNRSTIQKLLIEEEDKLGRTQEQLSFAETKAAVCRDRADRQRRRMDSFEPGTDDWVRAERLLVEFESLARNVESKCRQLRQRATGSQL